MKVEYRLRGFTLIELLIVVAIIAILAAIAVPNFLEAQTRAKVARIKADMRTVSLGLESYRIDHPKYPPDYAAVIGNKWAKWVLNPLTGPDSYFSLWALCPLTTPIAYLTSLPQTAFNTKGSKHNGTSSFMYDGKNHGSEWATSSYNPKPLSLPGNPGFPFFNLPETGWTAERKWRLRDVGPDLWANNQTTPDQPFYYCIYDSSNGTISNGDIVRWGP